MTNVFRPFISANMMNDFVNRHIRSCAGDLMRLANLMLEDQIKQQGLYEGFVRKAWRVRLHNRDLLPHTPIDMDEIVRLQRAGKRHSFWML